MDNGAALKELTDAWERWYQISYTSHIWHAERRDDGAAIHKLSAAALHAALFANYMHDPVTVPAK